jgi:hypothetical protein
MADQSDAAFKYYENARLKGRAITGSDLSSRFTTAEMKEGLRKQRKKLNPNPDDDIMDSQSKLRRIFTK